MERPDPPPQGEGEPRDRTRPANHLRHEKSPYLIQHAHNPVDWYPWSAAAFGRAAAEDKPIFLSIGYATCHWCHVMAHESFEDETVARLLNESFICIKVDREERPDIDSVYMAACQMMTGTGGWPLTIVMTPDKKPFFAGTYFPREAGFGRPGLLDLLPKISGLWAEKRTVLLRTAGEIAGALASPPPPDPSPVPDNHVLDTVYQDLVVRFDPECGGFGSAPKFPSPHVVMFLLRYWYRTGNTRALAMATKTLDEIRRGGIYDQIGFGVHRYSVDACWQVPHFEKMLYDQALLAIACTEAHLATKNPEYRRTAEEILTYILRDMVSPQGAFYSAEDADSEGREGAYYLWTGEEIEDVLGREDAALARAVFCNNRPGNGTVRWDGSTGIILRRSGELEGIAGRFQMKGDELEEKIRQIRTSLFSARQKRSRPRRDDKILADWNGFAIVALARAARAFGEQKYADAGQRAARFVLDVMHNPGGGLFHRYCGGDAAIPAFADDYSTMIWALIELYQVTFDDSHIAAAVELNRYCMEHFEDPGHGGFFTTSDASEQVLVRRKEVYDGAAPSCNSVMLYNLLRLGSLTGDYGLEKAAAALSRSVFSMVKDTLSGSVFFACALDYAFGPSYDVVINGDIHQPDARALTDVCNTEFLPSVTVLYRPAGLPASSPFAASGPAHPHPADGKAAAYVCSRNACLSPVTDPDDLRRVLGIRQP